jgi:hypothetical protein
MNYGNSLRLQFAAVDLAHDAGLIDQALQRVAMIPDPGTAVNFMGPHEKGLALFYMLSMGMFGIKLSSLFSGILWH